MQGTNKKFRIEQTKEVTKKSDTTKHTPNSNNEQVIKNYRVLTFMSTFFYYCCFLVNVIFIIETSGAFGEKASSTQIIRIGN